MHTTTLTLEEENSLFTEGVKAMATLDEYLQRNPSPHFITRKNYYDIPIGLEIKRTTRKGAVRVATKLISAVFPDVKQVPCGYRLDTLLSDNDRRLFLIRYRHGMFLIDIGMHTDRA